MNFSLDVPMDPAEQVASLNTLAINAMNGGRKDVAENACRNILKLQPEHPDALHNLALILVQSGRAREALPLAKKACEQVPNHLTLMNTLGMVYFELGHFFKAEDILQKVVENDPRNLRSLHNLGLTLRKLGRPQEAVKFLKKALKEDRKNIETLNSIGAAHAEMGHTKKATQYFRDVIKLNPRHLDAVKNLGSALVGGGDIEEGRKYLRQALTFGSREAEIYLTLARGGSQGQKKDAVFLGELEAEIAKEEKAKNTHALSYLYFAQAECLMRQKEYGKAFESFDRGNTIVYAMGRGGHHGQDKRFEQMKAAFTPEYIKSHEGWGSQSDVPIFILGMPRSGTTLVEQIISSHSQVGGAGEVKFLPQSVGLLSNELEEFKFKRLNELTPEAVERSADYYVQTLQKQMPGFPRITDKLPNNHKYIGFIGLLLPNAKIINCRRHPMDVVLSIYMQYFAERAASSWSFNLEHIAKEFKYYNQLMKYWDELFPGKIHHCVYEQLVEETERNVRAMLEYSQLPWEDACLRFTENKAAVRTASVYQVRKGIYTSSKFKWKKFEKQLEPARVLLEKEIAEYEVMLGVENE